MNLSPFPTTTAAIPSRSGLLLESAPIAPVMAESDQPFAALLAALPEAVAVAEAGNLPRPGKVLPINLPVMVQIADAEEHAPDQESAMIANPDVPVQLVAQLLVLTTPFTAAPVAVAPDPLPAPAPEPPTPVGLALSAQAARQAVPLAPIANDPAPTQVAANPICAVTGRPAAMAMVFEVAPREIPAAPTRASAAPAAIPVALLVSAATAVVEVARKPQAPNPVSTEPAAQEPIAPAPAAPPIDAPAHKRTLGPALHAAVLSAPPQDQELTDPASPPSIRPVVTQNATTGLAAAPPADLHQAAPTVLAPRFPEAPQPHDFVTLVDRLVAARDAAAPAPVSVSVPHAEFGRVAVRFDRDDRGLSVALTSPDPDFARAVTAALPPERQPPAGERPTGQAPAQHDAPLQRETRSGEGNPSRQTPARASIHSNRADDRPVPPPARRSGIFA